ncbi:hypothetical protein TGME49_277680 [Toxoplasma gondii ME49]|uniref:HIT-type domain-containing protein n=3 Tax=Toxoplasma gondii TaxID=5811 RepID=B6KRK0_TOXGV|nr:hypothetical protein TGME49_277680 [Toxoplasma gondii ME49]EPT25392.1 hypothetical protein TGME49_277680 [Toxoplasma gondii ME49]ESS28071.1 hypothetical protein TGVEG_277680 [Toxoplasma gondii VEG]KYF40547.1 hypothetical protein TGARI_277680 [Toxoplasma gondii ARI]CEL78838.1 TPA: hypothetical protein BN1205_028430 [Toxoplasma gondii VEG]|eukprot:XP_002370473.1 hypothetical protein TGME49_277680 [Toxoplasma gondii ME49]
MAQRNRQSPPAGTSRKRQHRDETDDESDRDEESDRPKTTKAERKDKKERNGRNFMHVGEKKKWKKRREPLDINLIIAQEEIDKSDAPCWATLHAGPSALLPRRLCCCCGFPAKYRCPLCANGRRVGSSFSATTQDAASRASQFAESRYQLQGRYVCSSHCLNVHQAHDCAPKHLLHWM